MVKYNRIRIVGGSGSGKTYLGKRLAQRFHLPHYDIDDIFWTDERDYINKRDEKERDKILSRILHTKKWVLEGSYTREWIEETYKKADCIIILKPHRILQSLRIIRRYFRRKLLEPKAKDNVIDTCKLLKWNWTYQKKNLIRLDQEKYKGKIFVFTRASEALKFLEHA